MRGRKQAPVAPVSSSTPVVLTLKHAVELSLSNSKDIQLASYRCRRRRTRRNSRERNSFPICTGGRERGFTYGLPETPGGAAAGAVQRDLYGASPERAAAGLAKEQQEQVRAQRAVLEDTRNAVMVRVASGYLELVKVRHSLELLRKEKESADKIVDVTKEREVKATSCLSK